MKELPGTSVLEHLIDTGKHSPVSVHLRHYAERERCEIEAQVKKVLVSGFIQSSRSS